MVIGYFKPIIERDWLVEVLVMSVRYITKIEKIIAVIKEILLNCSNNKNYFIHSGTERSMKIDDRKINRSIDDNRLISVD